MAIYIDHSSTNHCADENSDNNDAIAIALDDRRRHEEARHHRRRLLCHATTAYEGTAEAAIREEIDVNVDVDNGGGDVKYKVGEHDSTGDENEEDKDAERGGSFGEGQFEAILGSYFSFGSGAGDLLVPDRSRGHVEDVVRVRASGCQSRRRTLEERQHRRGAVRPCRGSHFEPDSSKKHKRRCRRL